MTLAGAAAVGAAFGVGGWEASRFFARDKKPGNATPPAPETPEAAGSGVAPLGPIIDTHVHVVGSNMPGVPKRGAAEPEEIEGQLEQTARTVQAQMKACGVEHALCMPQRQLEGDDDPLGVNQVRRLAKLVPGLHAIGIADPERFDEKHLQGVEAALEQGDVVAMKAFLGYLHHGPDSPGYRPYYRLAAKYQIPIIFHTGDTYSHLAKVKYAHPLYVDDVAVDFPETNFVLAHMGNPWLMDAAEVIYKNNKPGFKENVWADLSGLIVGSAADFERYRRQGVLENVIDDVRKAIEFAERPDRFLYGSDWPLAPMPTYRDFIRDLVPSAHHQAIFHDNAQALFKLG